MKSGNRTQAGFTLLELLVVISIFSLLLIALGGGVHFAGRAWRAQEEQVSRLGDTNAVQTVLRQMLASGRTFEGGPQNVRFVGRMPAALARGGLFDIELVIAGSKLILSWQPHFKGAKANLQRNSTVLLDGVPGLDVAYYSAQKGWQHAISGNSKSPEIIGIRAELSDARSWPALLVSPAINVSSNQNPDHTTVIDK